MNEKSELLGIRKGSKALMKMTVESNRCISVLKFQEINISIIIMVATSCNHFYEQNVQRSIDVRWFRNDRKSG